MLFGLLAMQFARHPEGVVEHGKRRALARINRWLESREGGGGVSPGTGGEKGVSVAFAGIRALDDVSA